jgi:hypothetical protein
MNERNLDQLLDAWLDLGPDVAPDRVHAAVPVEVRTTRQATRGSWWPVERLSAMNMYFRIATAATVVIAISLGTWYVIEANGGHTGTSAPTPSQSATSAIDGTYRTSFTKAQLADSPLLIDQGEINDENWGDLTLVFEDGRFWGTSHNAVKVTGATGTFTIEGDIVRMVFGEGAHRETFAYRWSLVGNTLTFRRDDSLGMGGPTPFLVKPWTRD